MGDRAEIRGDFVRRLFAVAVSVGFATTFAQMDWVQFGLWPNDNEWNQMAILGTGLVLTVLSWDGYLASINKKPLIGYPRFAIDIILVFIYMFFLISSKRPEFWLPVLAVAFAFYVAWDFFTVREHISAYDLSLLPKDRTEQHRATVLDILRIYVQGLANRKDIGRGPVITLSWTIYFAVLAIMNSREASYQVLVMCAFATLGLILYRKDKTVKLRTANVPGFSMWVRFLVIGLLLGFAELYFYHFGSS